MVFDYDTDRINDPDYGISSFVDDASSDINDDNVLHHVVAMPAVVRRAVAAPTRADSSENEPCSSQTRVLQFDNNVERITFDVGDVPYGTKPVKHKVQSKRTNGPAAMRAKQHAYHAARGYARAKGLARVSGHNVTYGWPIAWMPDGGWAIVFLPPDNHVVDEDFVCGSSLPHRFLDRQRAMRMFARSWSKWLHLGDVPNVVRTMSSDVNDSTNTDDDVPNTAEKSLSDTAVDNVSTTASDDSDHDDVDEDDFDADRIEQRFTALHGINDLADAPLPAMPCLSHEGSIKIGKALKVDSWLMDTGTPLDLISSSVATRNTSRSGIRSSLIRPMAFPRSTRRSTCT